MPRRDIIVVGASAGGVEALQTLTRSFSPDLPAAVFVVVHVPPRSRSFLPEILSAAGSLPAAHPKDGESVEPGRIYVAPPDRHLLLSRGHVHLGMGPKENHQRPCINVTFRSAAAAYDGRVIGAILSGQLDDGTAGLWDIKSHGGLAIVQNPEEAAFPSMPLSALREIEADHTVRIEEMGPLLTALVCETPGSRNQSSSTRSEMETTLTDITCPDCRGTIWEVPRGNGFEYRCRVGHSYTARGVLAEHFATQEKVLWSAIVALEEGASLAARLSGQLGPDLRDRLLEESQQNRTESERLRQILRERKTFSLDAP